MFFMSDSIGSIYELSSSNCCRAFVKYVQQIGRIDDGKIHFVIFFQITERRQCLQNQRQIILFSHILLHHAYCERIVIPAPPFSATSRHDDISDVLHHVRPIEPSRFPRASLGTMTSRSLELLPRSVDGS